MATTPENSALGAEQWFVRVGMHGNVGRFGTVEAHLRRDDAIVCRTARGVEIGTALNPAECNSGLPDGQILRKMTSEDRLWWAQLQELAMQAFENCQTWLQSQGSPSVLLDVEPLLDGQTLYFHFLDDAAVDQQLQAELDQLVAVYESHVKESRFHQLLSEGCGPGCGTEEAQNGCKSQGACAICTVASSCKR